MRKRKREGRVCDRERGGRGVSECKLIISNPCELVKFLNKFGSITTLYLGF